MDGGEQWPNFVKALSRYLVQPVTWIVIRHTDHAYCLGSWDGSSMLIATAAVPSILIAIQHIVLERLLLSSTPAELEPQINAWPFHRLSHLERRGVCLLQPFNL